MAGPGRVDSVADFLRAHSFGLPSATAGIPARAGGTGAPVPRGRIRTRIGLGRRRPRRSPGDEARLNGGFSLGLLPSLAIASLRFPAPPPARPRPTNRFRDAPQRRGLA